MLQVNTKIPWTYSVSQYENSMHSVTRSTLKLKHQQHLVSFSELSVTVSSSRLIMIKRSTEIIIHTACGFCCSLPLIEENAHGSYETQRFTMRS